MAERAYVRIAAAIRQKIADREEGWTPGSRLPTVAQLAARFGVSTATMDVAVHLLKQDDSIRGVQGGRMYVTGDGDSADGDDRPDTEGEARS